MMFKTYIIIAIIAAITVTGGFAYKFVNDLVNENAILAANNTILETSLEDSQRANDALIKDAKLASEVITNLNEDFQNARDTVNDLERKLSEHDIGYLAKNKPKLVEKIINDATADINRCFEIASGSPLTVDEANAILPSEINSECPELANPLYVKD